MLIVKETEKGLLLEKNCVRFWVQKRWLSGYGKLPIDSCDLTPAGTRAYAMAAREHWNTFGLDALKVFEKLRETDKAVLLRCVVVLPHAGEEKAADFWLPKAKTTDADFIKMKLREVLGKYPFVGARIKGL